MAVGPHLQGGADDWDKGMALLPYWSPVKFVDGGQRAAEAKALDERHHCHLRHHVGEQNPPQFDMVMHKLALGPVDKFVPQNWAWETDDELREAEKEWYSNRHDDFFASLPRRFGLVSHGMIELAETSEAMKAHARAYFESFIDASFDQFSRHIDSVSEYNEYFSNSQHQAERNRWIRWATACTEVWRDEYRPRYPWIGLVLAETAVGNDIPWELAALSHKYDWVHLGYHPYVPVYKGVVRPDAWRWYSGRWEEMDRGYRERGFTRVTWFFGEFGAVGHTSPPVDGVWPNALDPMGGWKHKNVYNGNVAMFNHMIKDWMDRTAQTLAWKQNRVIGATIFTSGGGNLWQWFELSGQDIIDVCRFVGQNAPPPGDDPIDPPPPAPAGLVNEHWQNRGWTDIPGTNKQRPFGWNFDFTLPGQMLPSGRKMVDTLSESVHKFVIPTPPDTRPTLPAREGLGGDTDGHTWDNERSGLVLFDPNTFTCFGNGTWHDRIWQIADFGKEKGNKSYKLTTYLDIHWQGFPPGNNPPAEEDMTLIVGFGSESEVWTSHDMPDRTWRKVELIAKTDGEGKIFVGVDIEAYWRHPRSVWLGGFQIEEVDDLPPPPPEDKCEAREPYNRTVWVLPAHATQEQWDKVAHDAAIFGRTVTRSYDDAGIGCGLASRTAVLFGIEMADRQLYRDWYNDNYTGTKVEWRALPVVTPIPQLPFVSPVADGLPVTQRFGDNYEIYMQRYGLPGHNGIDWAVNMGGDVLCAYGGSVLSTGYDESGYGLFIKIQHPQGVVTTYAHLSDTGIYAPGATVKRGWKIGLSGNSGWSSGPHLHFGVTVNGQSVNPESFLGPQA